MRRLVVAVLLCLPFAAACGSTQSAQSSHGGAQSQDWDDFIHKRVHRLNEFWFCATETGARARHPIDLRKSTCNDHIFSGPDVLECAFDLSWIGKVNIGFVHQQNGMRRQVRNQPVNVLCGGKR
jgi:hypothetical protein